MTTSRCCPAALAALLLPLAVLGCSRSAANAPAKHPGVCTSSSLPSWNDGPPRKAICDFVTRVTEAGGRDFVPIEDRIDYEEKDNASLMAAREHGWQVVSIKSEWRVVFAPSAANF